MALDLQAILNEAVSEVLEKKEEENVNESVTEPIEEMDNRTASGIVNQIKKLQEELKNPGLTPDHKMELQKQLDELKAKLNASGEAKEDLKEKAAGAIKKGYKAVKDAAEDHPYLAAATGALAAGAGALGLRKMIQKRGGLKK